MISVSSVLMKTPPFLFPPRGKDLFYPFIFCFAGKIQYFQRLYFCLQIIPSSGIFNL